MHETRTGVVLTEPDNEYEQTRVEASLFPCPGERRIFRANDSQLRQGHSPRLLALLNNTAPGLLARRGEAPLPPA